MQMTRYQRSFSNLKVIPAMPHGITVNQPNKDIVYFPQCTASNGIFYTGGGSLYSDNPQGHHYKISEVHSIFF